MHELALLDEFRGDAIVVVSPDGAGVVADVAKRRGNDVSADLDGIHSPGLTAVYYHGGKERKTK